MGEGEGGGEVFPRQTADRRTSFLFPTRPPWRPPRPMAPSCVVPLRAPSLLTARASHLALLRFPLALPRSPATSPSPSTTPRCSTSSRRRRRARPAASSSSRPRCVVIVGRGRGRCQGARVTRQGDSAGSDPESRAQGRGIPESVDVLTDGPTRPGVRQRSRRLPLCNAEASGRLQLGGGMQRGSGARARGEEAGRRLHIFLPEPARIFPRRDCDTRRLRARSGGRSPRRGVQASHSDRPLGGHGHRAPRPGA
jgi:hypothetical protein